MRPESFRLFDPADSRALPGAKMGRVTTSVFFGDHVEYEVSTDQGTITAVASDPKLGEIHAEGADVVVSFDPDTAWLLPRTA
ncbi:MAG: TOBE domain-containing protein [Tessaracoccus sp.]